MACTPNSKKKKKKVPKYIKWIPPKLGSMKLNTDDASVGMYGLAGVGGVFRNPRMLDHGICRNYYCNKCYGMRTDGVTT